MLRLGPLLAARGPRGVGAAPRRGADRGGLLNPGGPCCTISRCHDAAAAPAAGPGGPLEVPGPPAAARTGGRRTSAGCQWPQ